MSKTFKQLRDEWMGEGISDNINYCMPVNIGVIAQNYASFDEEKLNTAVENIMKQLKRWFGGFSTKNQTPSHNQLIVMTPGGNQISGKIIQLLQEKYGAQLVYTDEENIKKYCWVTIAAWDGIASQQEPVYQTIRGILSTADTPADDYILRFPENRPIFQIVLPDHQGTLPEINYKVREIYPHMLETINDSEPWFSRIRFIDQGLLKSRRTRSVRILKPTLRKSSNSTKKSLLSANRQIMKRRIFMTCSHGIIRTTFLCPIMSTSPICAKSIMI